MATQTPNLGLTLPVGTENVSRAVINGNNTLIDTFAGQMGSNLGILETGDTATHAIAKGEYVTWKGASYTADAAISIGETLAATGGSKNLTACDKGIANALNSNIAEMPNITRITNFSVAKDAEYVTVAVPGIKVGASVIAMRNVTSVQKISMFVAACDVTLDGYLKIGFNSASTASITHDYTIIWKNN